MSEETENETRDEAVALIKRAIHAMHDNDRRWCRWMLTNTRCRPEDMVNEIGPEFFGWHGEM